MVPGSSNNAERTALSSRADTPGGASLGAHKGQNSAGVLRASVSSLLAGPSGKPGQSSMTRYRSC